MGSPQGRFHNFRRQESYEQVCFVSMTTLPLHLLRAANNSGKAEIQSQSYMEEYNSRKQKENEREPSKKRESGENEEIKKNYSEHRNEEKEKQEEEKANKASKEEESPSSEGNSQPLSRDNSLENLYAESDAGYSSPGRQDSPHQDDGGGKSFLTWENAFEYLGKNHALLRPFQEVKRKQLKKERDFLLLQICQSEQQKNDAEKTNTKLGAQLYNLQEEVTRAQVKLDQAKLDRGSVKCSKQTTEENLKKAQKADEEQQQEVTKAIEKEQKLFMELSDADKRISLAKIIRSKSDSDLTALRHSLQSIIWDRKSLEKNRDIQDFHLDRLKASLRREENTLAILLDAAERAVEEANELKEAAREQEEELSAVERESKAVEKAWEENVFLMERKSDRFSEALNSLISLRAEEAGLRNEVLNTRKEVTEIQLEHERSTHRLLRLQNHIIFNRGRLTVAEEYLIDETEKKQNLEEIVAKMNLTLMEANKAYENESDLLNSVYKRLELATEHHRQLEDASFQKLNEQTTASKATENVKLKIKLLKERGWLLEDEMIAEEQLTAREALRASNLKNNFQSSMAAKVKIQELAQEVKKRAQEQEVGYRRKQERIKSNMNILDRLKTELSKILDLSQGDESTPLEREERALQLELKEAERLRLRLEQEAVLLQKDLLQTTKGKQTLEQKEHNLKKELQLLKDRSLRLKDEFHAEEMSLRRVELSRRRLDTAQRDVDSHLHQEKLNLEEATHLTGVSETELIAAVRELEKECSEENQHLETLRINLETSEEKLTEAMREKNLLEGRLLSAKKAKEEFLKEKGAQGEMEAMKKEINRMNVRWHTLEATQKELSQRLVRSVETEDSLKFRAHAILENVQRNPNSTKATREMQIDSLKRRINKNQKILNDIQQKTDSLQQQKRQVQDDLQMKQKMYMTNVKMLQEVDNGLQEKLAGKQEEQIYLQEERLRMRYLTSLKENRYRSLAANNREAQTAVELSLGKRIEAYHNVITQLVTAYPHLTRPLSAANRLLEVKRNN